MQALIKKRIQHRSFPANIAKFLGAPILKEHLPTAVYESYNELKTFGMILWTIENVHQILESSNGIHYKADPEKAYPTPLEKADSTLKSTELFTNFFFDKLKVLISNMTIVFSISRPKIPFGPKI